MGNIYLSEVGDICRQNPINRVPPIRVTIVLLAMIASGDVSKEMIVVPKGNL